jgi:hypothetical protein
MAGATPICRQHQLAGNAISVVWITAAVLARSDSLVTFDWDFVPLLPSLQAQTQRIGDSSIGKALAGRVC